MCVGVVGEWVWRDMCEVCGVGVKVYTWCASVGVKGGCLWEWVWSALWVWVWWGGVSVVMKTWVIMSWLWTDQLASHFTTLNFFHFYISRFQLRFGGVTIKKKLRKSLAVGQLEVRFAGQPGIVLCILYKRFSTNYHQEPVRLMVYRPFETPE